EPANVFEELLKGLEQSGDSIAPHVEVHELFSPFVRDRLPGLLQDAGTESVPPLLILADTRASASELRVPKTTQNCVIAIGPEAGWNAHEVSEFQSRGFQPVRLGERCMRVDTAAVFLSA